MLLAAPAGAGARPGRAGAGARAVGQRCRWRGLSNMSGHFRATSGPPGRGSGRFPLRIALRRTLRITLRRIVPGGTNGVTTIGTTVATVVVTAIVTNGGHRCGCKPAHTRATACASAATSAARSARSCTQVAAPVGLDLGGFPAGGFSATERGLIWGERDYIVVLRRASRCGARPRRWQPGGSTMAAGWNLLCSLPGSRDGSLPLAPTTTNI